MLIFNTLKEKKKKKTLGKNIVGKAEIAQNSHISIVVCNFFEFGMVSKWCIREWVKPLQVQSRLLTTLKEKLFENIVGKEENAGNQHFLLFPQSFLSIQKKNICF